MQSGRRTVLQGLKAALIAAVGSVLLLPASALGATQGGTLRLGMTAPLAFAVPTDFSMESRSIARVLCNGLVDVQPAAPGGSRALVPAIAAGPPAVTPDFRRFTFTIRAGLHYSNGSPVVAADVRDTFLRVLDPAAQFGPRFVDYYDAIEGALAYRLGNAATISGIVVAGNTVTFRLVRSDPSFVEALALPFVCISPAGTSHADGTIAAGTGPYRVLTQAGESSCSSATRPGSARPATPPSSVSPP